MNDIIEVENLEHVYAGGVQALANISFKVASDCKIFGILGPNGAGKTTLLNILTTSIKPTRGICRVYGFDIFRHPRKIRSLINYVTQEIEVDALLNVYDNLYIYGRLRGLSKRKADEKAAELIKLFELSNLQKRMVLLLSGGQMRRVQLAQRLMVEPKILFVDEPTLGLDPVGKNVIRNLLRVLSKNGTTVILSSNDMAEVEKLCENTIFINHGKIICQGSPDELKKRFSLGVVIRARLENEVDQEVIEFKAHDQNECIKILSQVLPKTSWINIREPTLEEVFTEIVTRCQG